MKTAVLNMCSKETLNYKFRTSPENGQPHPFHPTQLPLPHRINALLLVWQTPKLSTLPYQKKTFWGNNSPCYTTHLCQPILNQSPKDRLPWQNRSSQKKTCKWKTAPPILRWPASSGGSHPAAIRLNPESRWPSGTSGHMLADSGATQHKVPKQLGIKLHCLENRKLFVTLGP